MVLWKYPIITLTLALQSQSIPCVDFGGPQRFLLYLLLFIYFMVLDFGHVLIWSSIFYNFIFFSYIFKLTNILIPTSSHLQKKKLFQTSSVFHLILRHFFVNKSIYYLDILCKWDDKRDQKDNKFKNIEIKIKL